ncbi:MULTISPECIES: hypothetical protein [Bradyrhizobium]|uniref:hypothetical protein n=1 Tax=Bradyrhizobium TaxID=374 RepID=UPI00135B5D80|nr:hypothetical protein [Bradyrhizobium vignae]
MKSEACRHQSDIVSTSQIINNLGRIATEVLSYFFRINPISRAIRLMDPACRPSAAAISETTRRRASQASRFRSASIHSLGFDDLISK